MKNISLLKTQINFPCTGYSDSNSLASDNKDSIISFNELLKNFIGGDFLI